MKTDLTSLKLDQDYVQFLQDIRVKLKSTQLKLAATVNREVILFYWQLGKEVLGLQSKKQHWGTKFIEQLSFDLQALHPEMTGFSKRNLEYMRLLAGLYPDQTQFTQQPAAQLPCPYSGFIRSL